MTFNIIEAMEAKITPSEIGGLAEATGESPIKTRKTMSLGIVSIVGGLVRRAETASGAASLLSSLKGGAVGPNLLGEQADPATDALARSGGVSKGTASHVIGALLPIAAGVLGHQVMSRGLDAGGLSELLLSQKNLAIPTTSISGVTKERLEDRDVSISTAPHARTVATEPTGRGIPWLLLALGALLLGAFLILRGRKPEVPTVAMPAAPRVVTPRLHAPTPPAPTSMTTTTGADVGKKPAVQAPGAPANPAVPAPAVAGLGSYFVGNGALPERITLPGVTFESGSAKPVPGGDASLDQLAKAMKDHPTAAVRLEGFTDSVGGDGKGNMHLSYERAAVVKKELVSRGVDAGRLTIGGESDHDPLSTNHTSTGRAENRRVDAVITAR